MAVKDKKRYFYKIYDVNGVFLRTWEDDVVSDPSFSKSINGGLGELNVIKAAPLDAYGENDDVKYGNQLKLYVGDRDSASGTLIYNGELTRYVPDINENKRQVEITFLGYITHLEKTVMRGSYGRTLLTYNSYDPSALIKADINLYRFSQGATVSQSQLIGDTNGSFGGAVWYAQSFTTSATPSNNLIAGISATMKYLAATAGDITVTINIDDGGAPSKPTTVTLISTTTGELPSTAVVNEWVDFIFDEPYQLSASTKYWIVMSSPTSFAGNVYSWYNKAVGSYASGELAWSTNSGATWTVNVAADFVFKTYYINTAPKINYKDWSIRHDWNYIDSPKADIYNFGENQWRAQSFTPSANDVVHSVLLPIKYNTGTADDIIVTIETDNANKPSGILVSAGATCTIDPLATTDMFWIKFVFNAPVSVANGTKYWIVVKSPASSAVNTYYLRCNNNVSTHAGSHSGSSDSGSTWTDYPNYDFHFILYRSAPSIDYTDTMVSYEFNTNTCLEGIDKCLDLTPVNWYWHLDADNIIHLHNKSVSYDHTFTLRKDVKAIAPEKRIENIFNVLYYKGGEISPGVFLYKKYENSGSITTYGRKEMIKVDERLKVEASMDIAGQRIIDANQSPEIRTKETIVDNNGDNANLGYDIESIDIGNTLRTLGFSKRAYSLWDQALWDVDVWDYQISDVTATVMQIMRYTYNRDRIDIEAANKQPNINKRIEDINRNLVSSQTSNNNDKPEI